MSVQPSQFDSHRFVKRLTDAGVSEEVAEILADEHASRIIPADVATRSDVADVRAGNKADIEAAEERIRTSVREDILAAEAHMRAELATAVAGFRDTAADYKTSTLRWMFGMMMAFSGLVLTTVATLIVGLK